MLLDRVFYALCRLHEQDHVHGHIHPASIVEYSGQFVLANWLMPVQSPYIHMDTDVFSAPEVRAGQPPTAKSDTFSFAVVVAYLAGLPFPTDPAQPFEINTRTRAVGPAILEFLLKCLDQDPVKRPSLSALATEWKPIPHKIAFLDQQTMEQRC